MSAGTFKVEVRSNVVTRIVGLTSDEVTLGIDLDDPLAVSTLLANNNKANGNMDGDYYLGSFAGARHFASLCLSYQKALCEKSYDSIQEAGADGIFSWTNIFVPSPDVGPDV